ncbi:MAG: hypothetical protein AMJ81_05530 [Phycisphaerae bacterium SM23_33]|nr:MAG: hypothetical protein AMJ81_05530 [Phycisphaerae bacterium SM23_33]
MKILSQRPWYAEGLAFECIRCGRCCAGPEEGYVWIGKGEIDKLAEFLKLSVEEVHRRYLRRVGRRFSLLETPETKDCIFLGYTPDGRSSCTIYPVRPTQCRTWPFWPLNLISPAAWSAAGLRCPGINRGPLRPLDEIQQRRERTST